MVKAEVSSTDGGRGGTGDTDKDRRLVAVDPTRPRWPVAAGQRARGVIHDHQRCHGVVHRHLHERRHERPVPHATVTFEVPLPPSAAAAQRTARKATRMGPKRGPYASSAPCLMLVMIGVMNGKSERSDLGRGLAERGWDQKKLQEIMFEMDKALVSGQYTTKMVKSVQ